MSVECTCVQYFAGHSIIPCIAGTGITSTGNEYAFTLTRRESGGMIEVKLKDLNYTREGETFFTSPRFSVGGFVWKLSFMFDRTFKLLPWLSHWGWRNNLKAKFLFAWDLYFLMYSAGKKVAYAVFEMFNECIEHTYENDCIKNCALAIRNISGDYPPTNNGGAPLEGWHVKSILRWTTNRMGFLMFLILVFLPWFILAEIEALVFVIFISVIVPMLYLGGPFFFFLTAPIWYICYYFTSPLWYQTESITSTLCLLSDRQTRLKHSVAIRHTCPFLSKTRSQKKTLQANEICELKGLARARPCLKPDSGFCPNGWLTIIVDIDIEGPANHVQRNNEATQVLEEGQRVEHTIDLSFAENRTVEPCESGESRIQHSQSNERSECVVCLVNKQTSGFAHKNTVHICVCEECAKVYDNLKKQSSVRCPYCNQSVEYIVYKVF